MATRVSIASFSMLLVIFLVLGDVKCITDIFGEKTEKIVFHENIVAQAAVLRVQTAIIEFPDPVLDKVNSKSIISNLFLFFLVYSLARKQNVY